MEKHGEWYWLNAPAYDPEELLTIGQFSKQVQGSDKWFIGGKLVNAGPGIEALRRIPKPKGW
jgi:hypothetical protein